MQIAVLIFSFTNDPSTDDVIDWLRYYNISYFRVNDSDKLEVKSTQLGKAAIIQLSVNGTIIIVDENVAVWYRKGVFHLFCQKYMESTRFGHYIDQYLQKEHQSVLKALFDIIGKHKNSIGNANTADNNKLYYLDVAQKCGLNIPDTIVTTRKCDVQTFLGKHAAIITKSPYEQFYFEDTDGYYSSFTEIITEEHLSSFTDQFPVSLFQEYIDKNYEIRVFFLHEKFSAMAIFSQESEQTKVDFRQYDDVEPNPTVPCRLSAETVSQLRDFSLAVGLNSGSIDLVKASNGQLYFLEVNPVGQFGMVSYPCNYFLEREIAKWLAKKT